MSQNWEVFLRGLLTVIVFAVVTFAANQANLTGILPAGIATLVAAIAGMIDKMYSPDGTLVFGTFGVQR